MLRAGDREVDNTLDYTRLLLDARIGQSFPMQVQRGNRSVNVRLMPESYARGQILTLAGSEFDATRLTVSYQGTSGDTPLDTASTGGNLGGLLEFRSRILDPAR